MTTFLNYMKNIFKYLLILSKVIMILLSFYYLLNFNLYSITINVPISLRSFSIIDLPLKTIEHLSMFLIIIPLTIILLSFYYPESQKLRILAGFCAIGGNLFSVAHLASKGLLEESFRTFFLTIYNVPSLDVKIKLFSDFFNQRINIHTSTVENITTFRDFIQKQLNSNFDSYVNILKTLPQLDIMSYASRTADQLYNNYIQSLVNLNTLPTTGVEKVVTKSSLSEKVIKWLGYALLAGAVAFIGWKTYQNVVLLKDAGSEIVDNGKRITQVVHGVSETDTLLSATNKAVNGVAEKLLDVSTKVDTLGVKHATLTVIVNNNTVLFQTLLDRVRGVELQIQNIDAEPLPQQAAILGQNVPELLGAINHQIESLAVGGLKTNNDLSKLANSILNLENQIKEIAAQRVTTITNIVGEKSQLAAQAADLRWIEEARSKIREFDVLTAMKEIKTIIQQQTKPIAEEMKDKVDDFITTAKTTITDNKANLTKQINKVSSDLAEVKQTVTNKVAADSLQANAIQNIDDRLKTVETNHNKASETLEGIRSDVATLKQKDQTLTTSVNTQIMEMQTSLQEAIIKISKQFSDYKLYIASTVRLTQNVRTDNANISMGTYVPRVFSSDDPVYAGLISRRLGSNNNNNNNNNQ
uniref:ORF-640 n=1 Tax=Physarum polycephalum TaxID=5791 RepID=Q35593_PHYPO|nr:unassigned reading frame [Physarum polycephalum]AAC15942.1 unassigned reading frame [Physarum polycephalum]BAA06115.1 ORF-640 [Physarum polycephalum]